jgi:hypothetical protein
MTEVHYCKSPLHLCAHAAHYGESSVEIIYLETILDQISREQGRSWSSPTTDTMREALG